MKKIIVLLMLVFIGASTTIYAQESKSESRRAERKAQRDAEKAREKIEEEPKKPKHIITEWGVGYRFE